MDGEQRKEARREAHQVWPPPLGTQTAGYDIRQYNFIIEVLGGWSTEVDEAMRELFATGARGGEILLWMQRAVISRKLNIARTLKVMS